MKTIDFDKLIENIENVHPITVSIDNYYGYRVDHFRRQYGNIVISGDIKIIIYQMVDDTVREITARDVCVHYVIMYDLELYNLSTNKVLNCSYEQKNAIEKAIATNIHLIDK